VPQVVHDAGTLASEPTVARSLAAALRALPAASGVVLLGLPREMEALLRDTPGLTALVPSTLRLPDLTAEQVAVSICRRATERFGIPTSSLLERQLAPYIAQRYSLELSRQNAALGEALLETAVGRFSLRVARSPRSTAPSPRSSVVGADVNGLAALEYADFVAPSET